VPVQSFTNPPLSMAQNCHGQWSSVSCPPSVTWLLLSRMYNYLCTFTLLTSHMVSNAPDFASRASHPEAAVWPQLIAMPLGFSLVSFIGIIVSSSSTVIFGESIWNPIDLLGRFLDGSPSHATRFGVSSDRIHPNSPDLALTPGLVHLGIFHHCPTR
jgi:cytosine/uracil/thiamine/allantoin permease